MTCWASPQWAGALIGVRSCEKCGHSVCRDGRQSHPTPGSVSRGPHNSNSEVGLAGRTSWRCHPPGQSLHVHVTLPTVKCPHTGHCVALLTPGPDIGHCLQQAAGAGSSACPCPVCNIYLQLKLYRALQPGRAAVSMRTKKRSGAGPQRQLSQLVHYVLEHVRQQAAAGSGSGNRQVTGPGPQ